MRGRAIRIDPADPGKAANIWHLATIEPQSEGLMAEAANVVDWGRLNDDGADGLSDATLLQRRFRAFEGISNGRSTLIESGIGRLDIDTAADFGTANRRTFGFAADRAMIARRWVESSGDGQPNARVRETATPNYAPRQLAWRDTMQALIWSAAGSNGFAAGNEARNVTTMHGIGVIGMGVAGVALLATLPNLVRAARLMWRNGSLEGV